MNKFSLIVTTEINTFYDLVMPHVHTEDTEMEITHTHMHIRVLSTSVPCAQLQLRNKCPGNTRVCVMCVIALWH